MLFAGLVVRPRLVRAAAGLCLALSMASDVRAQSAEWSDRAFVAVNMALQLTTRPFDEQLTPLINAERAVLGVEHPGEGGKPSIEAGGGLRLWRNLGIGGDFVKRTLAENPEVRAVIPHPILFGQPRSATKAAPFERSEWAVHAHAVYMIPVTPRMDIALSAGPSLVNVRQDLLQGIEVAEAGAPFTSVAIGSVAVLSREVRTVAAHAGVDVTWFLTPAAGIGFTARYVHGSAATQLTDGSSIDLDVGGLQVGWGARLRLR